MLCHLGPVRKKKKKHTHSWNNKSKMLDKIKSLSTKVKNQHEKCQCLLREREEKKDILKYTFIQSLRKIKQQNWSAPPSTLAPLPLPATPRLDAYRLSARAIAMTTQACPTVTSLQAETPDYYGVCCCDWKNAHSNVYTRRGSINK